MIRRPARSREARAGAVGCHAIDTREAWLGHAALDSIGDAADLDPRDRTRFADTPGPLFVVCTHGRRDPCCAERGRPLAEALAASATSATWESTHVGGDRFAGNVVAFPHGLYFGRVEPEEASTLVRAYGEHRIAPLDRYRGRSSDPFDVQAAEIALRRRLGLDRIDDVRPRRRAKTIDRGETIFSTSAGPHRVRVERAFGEPMRLTCHSAREERPASWRVVDVEPVPAED